MSVQRNGLVRKDAFAVYAWIQSNKQAIIAARLNGDQLAEKVSAEVKVSSPISATLLRRLISDMGIDPSELIINKKPKPCQKKGRFSRILATQLAQTQILLSAICQQLGFKHPAADKLMPEWLAKYAGGKTSVDTAPVKEE